MMVKFNSVQKLVTSSCVSTSDSDEQILITNMINFNQMHVSNHKSIQTMTNNKYYKTITVQNNRIQNISVQSISVQNKDIQNKGIQSIGIDKNKKLKNELCRNYLNNGYCRYYDRCQFAHGIEELRQSQKYNMKYKTKQCQSYFIKGYCQYGERCNFLHHNTYSCLNSQINKWKQINKMCKQINHEHNQTVKFTSILHQNYRIQSRLLKIISNQNQVK